MDDLKQKEGLFYLGEDDKPLALIKFSRKEGPVIVIEHTRVFRDPERPGHRRSPGGGGGGAGQGEGAKNFTPCLMPGPISKKRLSTKIFSLRTFLGQ
jgi:hypothetical protein